MADTRPVYRTRRQEVLTEWGRRTPGERDSFDILDWYWSTRAGNGNVVDLGDYYGVDYRTFISQYWELQSNMDTTRMHQLALAAGFYELRGTARARMKQKLIVDYLTEVG